jgi:spore germination cell wall hydrolase CwlJ-like protein
MILPIFDDLTLIAATVCMEAGNQSFTGKVAVAYVILNRDRLTDSEGVDDVVLAPWQFSAWNTDNRNRARLQDTMRNNPALWSECMKATAAALWEFVPDPTHGATMYLNPVVTKKIRGGTLPDWYDAAKVTAVIGDHEFLSA